MGRSVQIEFEALFANSPNPYIVLDPSLAIVWMNKAYLAATMREREEIIGQSMFDAFPSDPLSESYRLLKSSLDRVVRTQETDEIALIRYDIRNTQGSMDARYWSATHTPIMDDNGKLAFILQHTVDVTELQSLRALRDEMGIVQRAQAVQARNHGLAAESDRMRSLFEQAPGFVAILRGPDHIFQLANQAYRQLVGMRELNGRTVAEAMPEVVDQGFVNLLTQVYNSGVAYVGQREKIVLHDAASGRGQERYLDFIYQPIFTDGGQVSGIFVQGYDVTDHVAAEEHQKLLINELNHRVKNTLAIVLSLAAQSFRNAASLEAAQTTLTARLSALANAYSHLTGNNWEAARLAETIEISTAAVAGAATDRIDIAGPEVTLQPQAAMALAMIVHELSTNATKYGALSSDGGRVAIDWSFTEIEGEQELVVNWVESGGPPVEPPTRRGFGTRLIESGIPSRKSSDVQMSFHPEGLRCRIATRIAGNPS